ncbi:MAG: hypothetical protein CVT64_01425 [Actinobacteria bacterium HGW-Actinobacteria-4]|nr:MAG: hypothetical protein CVT64_01425 [Actinobacteria bacterium HGW-Actinobacteria-4]
MRTLRLAGLAVVAALVMASCAQATVPTANVGDCLAMDMIEAVVEQLPTVPCDEPHDAEVYAVLDLVSDAAFDAAVVDESAFDACEALFEDFVGTPYDDSVIEVWYLFPDSVGWAAGDREVICTVAEIDWNSGDVVPVTGTLAGANR